MKTFRTGGREKHTGAENNPRWLLCSAHGLFILRISSGDLRAGHCGLGAGWQRASCDSQCWMEFKRRRTRKNDAMV